MMLSVYQITKQRPGKHLKGSSQDLMKVICIVALASTDCGKPQLTSQNSWWPGVDLSQAPPKYVRM